MEESNFGPNKTGRLIRATGIFGSFYAFIPDPLPPRWDWPTSLWPLLAEAKASLARLDGVGKHLPDPQILLRPLQNREAQKSSSLEGTYTEPEQQLLFQIDPQQPQTNTDPANAYREVFNYAQALRSRLQNWADLPLSLRLIKDFHRTLAQEVPRFEGEPGEFRRTQNQIGRPPRYVPPPPEALPECLDLLEKYLHSPKRLDSLVEAFIVHYQFEAIHPFRDGNGRVGRLLLAVTIMEWCGLSNQWLYMSAYFDRNRDEYIDRLLRVSTHAEWEEWISFCLKGVIEQAADTEKRCDKLLEVQRMFKDRIRGVGGSFRLTEIVDDLLLVVPILHIPYLAHKFNVTYPTAKADVDRLLRADILKELPGARRKAFYAPEVVSIIYGDLD